MRRMKKMTGLLAAVSMMAVSLSPAAVQADSQKVVTLGADLTDSQKSVMLKYFGVSADSVQVIEVTNQEERDTLGSYVPLEQIGTRTLSCAYVQPTASGGIQVKTANLNFVTSNMIAAALSTSGVKNCNVVAACPIEVSGTGALTGVTKAFEAATNTALDAGKKQTAAKEIVTTGKVAEAVGQKQATEIVNDIKIQIIQNQVAESDTEQITNIVNDAVDDASNPDSGAEKTDSAVTVRLSDEDRQALEDLAKQIAAEKYNYDDVKETLDRVEKNTSSGDTNVNVNVNVDNSNSNVNSAENTNTNTNTDSSTESLSSDNIMMNTDDAALGKDVIEDATNQQALTGPDSSAPTDSTASDGALFTITAQDEYEDSTAQTAGSGAAQDDEQAADSAAVQSSAAQNSASLSETAGADAATDTPAADAASSAPAVTQAPAIAFAAGDLEQPLLNSFALRFYVEGRFVPASGTVTITDSAGNEVKTVDLSNTAAWGSVDVTDDEKLNGLGWEEATEIDVLTGDAPLTDGTYTISGSIAFAAKGEDGMPQEGTVTEAAVIDGQQIPYASSTLTIQADTEQGFKAGNTASLTVAMPDGAATAEVTSAHEEVASLPNATIGSSDESGAEAPDQSPLSVSLNAAGDTELDVTYYDADGSEIGTQTLSIAVF